MEQGMELWYQKLLAKKPGTDLDKVLKSLEKLNDLNRNHLALTRREEKIIRITLEWYRTGDTSDQSAEIFDREWKPSEEDLDQAAELTGLDTYVEKNLEENLGHTLVLALSAEEQRMVDGLIRTSGILTEPLMEEKTEDKEQQSRNGNAGEQENRQKAARDRTAYLRDGAVSFGRESTIRILYYLNDCLMEPEDPSLWEERKDDIYLAVSDLTDYLLS